VGSATAHATLPATSPRWRLTATTLAVTTAATSAVTTATSVLVPVAALAGPDDGVFDDVAAPLPWIAIAVAVAVTALVVALAVRSTRRRRQRSERLDAATGELEWLLAEASPSTDIDRGTDPVEVRERADRLDGHLGALTDLGNTEVRDAAADLRGHVRELAEVLEARLGDVTVDDRHRLDVRIGELRERSRVGADRLVATVRR
jgi:hypothetical protein